MQQIKRRTTRGHYARAKAGHVKPGRTAVYGYKYIGQERGGRLEIDPTEAEVVRMIFNWYTEEKIGTPTIAYRLAKMGVPTKLARLGIAKRKQASAWASSTIGAILRNQVYVGRWVFGRGATSMLPSVVVPVPAIIEEAQFFKARKQAKQNFSNAKRSTKNEYLFRRRVTCGDCGGKMSCATSGGGGRSVYRCRNANGETSRPVHEWKVYADDLDGRVWESIKNLLLTPQQVREGWEQYRMRTSEGRNEIERAMRALGTRADELRAKRERVVGLYADGLVPRESLDKQVADINSEIAKTDERLADLRGDDNGQPSIEDLETAEAFLAKLSVGAEAVGFEDKEKIVNILDARIVLHRDMRARLSVSIGGVPHVMLLV